MRAYKSIFIFTFILAVILIPQRMIVKKASGLFAANSKNLFNNNNLSSKALLLNNEFVNLDIISDLVNNDKPVKAGLLYDLTDNKIVWGKNMTQQLPIASLSKMMTSLLVLEEIKERKINLNSLVETTNDALQIWGSRVNMKLGQIFTVEDLLQATMIASANNATYLLAQYISGSEKEFVIRMNKRAKQLGMKNTFFTNCHGMPVTQPREKDNASSAVDLLILAKELLKYNTSVEIASMPGVELPYGKRKYFYHNHNRFVIDYKQEVDGLKTGWTVNAGYCLVATSKRCDHRLISIVMGASNGANRYVFVSNLLNKYYCNIGVGKLGECIKETKYEEISAPKPSTVQEED